MINTTAPNPWDFKIPNCQLHLSISLGILRAERRLSEMLALMEDVDKMEIKDLTPMLIKQYMQNENIKKMDGYHQWRMMREAGMSRILITPELGFEREAHLNHIRKYVKDLIYKNI